MLIGTDFLWKAVRAGKLRQLLSGFAEDDWVCVDRNGDLAVIRAENFEKEKNLAYPGDVVVDLMSEQIRPAERSS